MGYIAPIPLEIDSSSMARWAQLKLEATLTSSTNYLNRKKVHARQKRKRSDETPLGTEAPQTQTTLLTRQIAPYTKLRYSTTHGNNYLCTLRLARLKSLYYEKNATKRKERKRKETKRNGTERREKNRY
ncbi:unnamed protein product [Hymenolepis diminuta]|uniref:Transposase n=1 Tax=Hymenolepis diminuta TaxID=6216 RepID=A0A0R3SUA0_HYMDI|nr:unnamed protein product [Hymenolepis diminuta]